MAKDHINDVYVVFTVVDLVNTTSRTMVNFTSLEVVLDVNKDMVDVVLVVNQVN